MNNNDMIDLCKSIGFSEVEIKTFYQSYRIVDEIERPYSFFIMCATK